jgi:hypothetical protein
MTSVRQARASRTNSQHICKIEIPIMHNFGDRFGLNHSSHFQHCPPINISPNYSARCICETLELKFLSVSLNTAIICCTRDAATRTFSSSTLPPKPYAWIIFSLLKSICNIPKTVNYCKSQQDRVSDGRENIPRLKQRPSWLSGSGSCHAATNQTPPPRHTDTSWKSANQATARSPSCPPLVPQSRPRTQNRRPATVQINSRPPAPTTQQAGHGKHISELVCKRIIVVKHLKMDQGKINQA